MKSPHAAERRLCRPEEELTERQSPIRYLGQYNAVRGERSRTGCISRSAASEVHRGWQQKCCRTWKRLRSASQPSSGRIEVGREDIHLIRRGHRYSDRLGL